MFKHRPTRPSGPGPKAGSQASAPINGGMDQQVMQWFKFIDVDRNGQLDAKELQRALALGNLHFSLKATGQMIRCHDTDRSGTISLPEFLKLHQFLITMQNSFRHFDADRSGELDAAEVRRALQHAGFQLDEPPFMALFQSFDPDRNNSIGLSEFIAMSLFLQSATATFRAFDTGQGRITLDFNQWIYACSNVI